MREMLHGEDLSAITDEYEEADWLYICAGTANFLQQ